MKDFLICNIKKYFSKYELKNHYFQINVSMILIEFIYFLVYSIFVFT